jgi:gluconolactonase
VKNELSRRSVLVAGAAAITSPAFAQPPGGPPAPGAGAPPQRPPQKPYTGPQVAPPAAPLGPPYANVGSVEKFDPSLDAVIDVNTPVEKVMGGLVWVEGPVWVGGKDGYLLCSDTRANKIVKWQYPGVGKTTGGETWKMPAGYEGPNNEGWAPNLSEPGTNGMIRARGGLVVGDQGNRTVAFIDLKTKAKTHLARGFEGKRFNSPNDLTLHPNGCIFFTDPPFGLLNVFNSPDREMDYTGVFRLNPDNTVTLVDKTLRPNGIGLSPDGSKLYCTDSSGWVVFDVDKNGNTSNRRVFVPRSELGGGDSLKIDNMGNMWTSSTGGISIVNPQGKRIGLIKSDDRMANCEIGEDGYVYIASNVRIIRAKVKVKKIHRKGE